MKKIFIILLLFLVNINSSFAALKTDFASGQMECSLYAPASAQNNFIEQLSCYRKADRGVGCTIYIDKSSPTKQDVRLSSFCFNALELSLL